MSFRDPEQSQSGHDATNSILTAAFSQLTGSLLQNVSQCRPWVGDDDRDLAETVAAAALRQRDHIRRIATIMQARRLPVQPGRFPTRFAHYNDIGLRFLVPLLVDDLRELINGLKSLLSDRRVDQDVSRALQAAVDDMQLTMLIIGNGNILIRGGAESDSTIPDNAVSTAGLSESVIQRQHELETAIQRVAEIADQDLSAAVESDMVETDLQTLFDGLSELLVLKEVGGFFDDLIQFAFHMQHTVEQLKADHRQLLEELRLFQKDVSMHPRRVRRLLRGWLARFTELEHRESRILQDTCNVDVGSID